MSTDPNLLGEWQGDEGRYVFRADDFFLLGTVNIPYFLEDSGNKLNINNISYYKRLSGAPSTIVGHWRDDPNVEEFYYRADGRYITLSDNESLVNFGTYTASATSLTSYEFRGRFGTQGDQLTFYPFSGPPTTGTYEIVLNTLTIDTPGGPKVFTRI